MDNQTSKRIYQYIQDNYDEYMEVIAPVEREAGCRNVVLAFDKWAAKELHRTAGIDCGYTAVTKHRYALQLNLDLIKLEGEDFSDINYKVLSGASGLYVHAEERAGASEWLTVVDAGEHKYKTTGRFLLLPLILEILRAERNGTHKFSGKSLEDFCQDLREPMRTRRWRAIKPRFSKYMDDRKVSEEAQETHDDLFAELCESIESHVVETHIRPELVPARRRYLEERLLYVIQQMENFRSEYESLVNQLGNKTIDVVRLDEYMNSLWRRFNDFDA